MQAFSTIETNVFEYSCLHYSPQELADPAQIDNMILRDLQLSGLRPRQLENSLVIMNYLGEAVDSTMARPLMTALRQRGAEVSGIFMVHDQNTVDYASAVIPHWCSNHCDWLTRFEKSRGLHYDLNTKLRLICLNRRHSPVRTKVVHYLLDNFQSREILISHESKKNLHSNGPVPKLLLDGPVDSVSQHQAAPEEWLRAAIKLITEGNEQNYSNVPETVLVSEKTFKCFAWRQFPIWISVPGTVQAVRDMGFDVFDDHLDHSYDLECDQDRRVDMILDMTLDFASRPMHQLAALRKRMTLRFNKNYQRLRQLANLRDRDLKQARQRFIEMFAQNTN